MTKKKEVDEAAKKRIADVFARMPAGESVAPPPVLSSDENASPAPTPTRGRGPTHHGDPRPGGLARVAHPAPRRDMSGQESSVASTAVPTQDGPGPDSAPAA